MAGSSAQADRERTEARIGYASNILGLTAGAAATGAALSNPALRKPSTSPPGPVSGRVIRHAEGREKFLGSARLKRMITSPRGRAALIAGGAGSALALQVANLGGDVVANRVLARESGMKKSWSPVDGQSLVSKSEPVRVTGHGVNLEKALRNPFRMSQARADKKIARIVHSMENPSPRQQVKAQKWVARIDGPTAQAIRQTVGGAVSNAVADSGPSFRRNAVFLSGAATVPVLAYGGVSAANRMADRKAGKTSVNKRNFNAEADRQRRLGLYAGLGLGSGLVTGEAARRLYQGTAESQGAFVKPHRLRLKSMPRGKQAALAALLAASAGGIGGGAWAYRRGIQERNQPWG